MDYKELRIVFMGTPDFAVSSLKALVEAGCNIIGVITAPDRAAGRGMKLRQSAVAEYALKMGLHLLQPEKLKDLTFIADLKSLNADLQVVVAFRMLPEIVWNMPPMGTINLHGSLLPKYRGAAPINWAIINGETETGVTTFKLQHAIDTGNILLQERIPIAREDTAGELHDKMKEIGAALLVETIKQISEGCIAEKPQNLVSKDLETDMPHAPKLFTETCMIDWEKDCETIFNLIRGLSPIPGAMTRVEGKIFKIYKCSTEKMDLTVEPGTIFSDNKSILKFACNDGFISVIEIQPEGKKRMLVSDFLRGNKLQTAQIIN